MAYLIFKEIGNDGSADTIRLYGLVCFVHFVLMFVSLKQITHKYLSLYACYLMAFFLFQCGQYVLYAFNVDYNYFYIESYSKSIVAKSVMFSTLCNGASFLAAPFCLHHKENRFIKKINSIDADFILPIAKLLFLLFSFIEIPYCMIRFYVAIQSGYNGVRNLEASLPSFFSLIDMLYIPSILLCTIYEKQNKKKYVYVLVFWSVITCLNGDRSSGIGGLLIFSLMFLNGILKVDKRKIYKRRYVTIALIFLLSAYLIPFAYNFRNQQEINSLTINGNIITDVVGELGFSFFPLVLTMVICPSKTDFLYGKSIFASIISAFFPASLDFFGIFTKFFSLSTEGRSWLDKYFNYNFGLGYSLNAESYSNFGEYGYIWIFILSILVAKILAEPDFTRNNNKFSQYASMSLLFVLFTMPRRSCYYLFNFYIYYVIIIGLLLLLFSKSKSKKASI